MSYVPAGQCCGKKKWLVSAYANSSKTLGIGLDKFCCGVFER
jgi:hypothetical protein